MTVNKKWKMGNDICPICHTEVENWHHVITCKDKDIHRTRENFIDELCKKLDKHRTYPPLKTFIIECFRFPTFDTPPPPPLIGRPRYVQLFHNAYESQWWIGWKKFYRGYISTEWEKIQYRYYLEICFRDIYAVDKWCRMKVTSILEFTRIIWNERCTIVQSENEHTYETRTRRKMQNVCTYLQRHQDLVPPPQITSNTKRAHFFYPSATRQRPHVAAAHRDNS